MEGLRILEEKVTLLVQSKREDAQKIARLQEENTRLLQENGHLVEKVNMLEETLLTQGQSSEKLDEEHKMTELVVEELIQHIDGVLEKESQV